MSPDFVLQDNVRGVRDSKYRLLLLHLLLAATFCIGASVGVCPEVCTCKWKGGKKTVECVNKHLTSIPEQTDPGTQVLDLTGSSLVVLSHEKFRVSNLTNLQRIYMPHCKLAQIDDSAFRGLSNLIELDLSHNELRMLPSAAFSHVDSLMRLQLSHNSISRIKDRAFRVLKHLTSLELTGCSIETIEPRAFQGLESLAWLKLDSNKLTSLHEDMYFPKSLHGIDLHDNPWNCDCRLQKLRSWLVKYNVPSSIEPKCSLPSRLETKNIKSLSQDDLACSPEVRPTSLFLDVVEGRNVSFECHVVAEPAADIQWKFNGQTLENSSFVYNGSVYFDIYEEWGMTGERISHLRIDMVTELNSGVFQCAASNAAGHVVSNFTLRVNSIIPEPLPTEITLDHVIYIGGVLVTLIFILFILCCILIWRCIKIHSKRRDKQSGPTKSSGNSRTKNSSPSGNNMPKYIQMGTTIPKANGIAASSSISVIETRSYRDGSPRNHHTNPDIISDGLQERVKPAKKRVSIIGVEEVDEDGGVTTRRLDDIMEEYEDTFDPTYEHVQLQSGVCRHKKSGQLPIESNPYPLIEIPADNYIHSSSCRERDLESRECNDYIPEDESVNEEYVYDIGKEESDFENISYYPENRKMKLNHQEHELLYDQKYPEQYHYTAGDESLQGPDHRYSQSYGLLQDKFCIHSNTICECCQSSQNTLEYPMLEQSTRIGGDGCSFDNLMSSCGGVECCYLEDAKHAFDNSLPDNYRPLELEPLPPEGYRDEDQEPPWCEHTSSPQSVRIVYAPEGSFEDQSHHTHVPQPKGTEV